MCSLTNDIHPIVRAENFSADFDQEVLEPSLRLLSQILDSPQSLHHYYVILYGKNQIAPRPSAKEGVALQHAPQVYACSKGIKDLTERHNEAVRTKLLFLASRVRFVLADTDDEGSTEHRDIDGIRGSLIKIGRPRYDMLLTNHSTRDARQLEQFNIAVTLLHEMAHAANRIWFKEKTEHFFENSIIAECGFEYEARIFGLNPRVSRPEGEPAFGRWFNWQMSGMHGEIYDLDEICCDRDNLPDFVFRARITPKFLRSLFTDHFWNVTMLNRGALGLIDQTAADFLDPKKKHWTREDYAFKLPQSILDLYEFRSVSSAAKTYRALRNPHMELRERLCDDVEDDENVTESGESGPRREKVPKSTPDTSADVDDDDDDVDK